MSLKSVPGMAAGRGQAVSLRAAVVVAVLGGVLLALGGVFPVVAGARPGFRSAPLLVIVALVPVLIAAVLLGRRRPVGAAGVLAGLAALAPGSIVLAAQFAVDASSTSRPALYAPQSLASPAPAVGLWLLIAGELALVCAGWLSVTVVRAEGLHASEGARTGRRRLLLGAIFASGLAAVGLLMAPFSSTDAYLLARGAFSATGVVLTGSLLLAAALPLAAVLAMSSPVPGFGRGCLAGLGLGALALSLPDLVAASSMPQLGIGAGPIVAIVGAVGLLALALVRRGESVAPVDDSGSQAGYARMPSQRRLELATAALAVLTCLAAVAGAVTAHVTATGALAALRDTEQPTRWLLVAAGGVIGMLGLCLLPSRQAALVRPVVSVGWVAVVLAGTAALGAGVAASAVGGVVTPGPGVLWTVLAMVLATVTACFSAVTGIVEREDVDIDGARGRRTSLLVASGILAVPTFVLPVAASPEYSTAGLVTDLATSSWGLLAGLLGVGAALLVAAHSRTTRAAAVLAGAALVVGLRVAQWPLLGIRIDGLSPEPGWWFALGCAVLLVLTTGVFAVADRLAPSSANKR